MISRRVLRQTFHQILTNELTQIPAANIKASRLVNPQGLSPLIYITSSGSERPPLTTRLSKSAILLDVFVLVLLVDAANPSWTEDKAENLLDDIEAQIPDILREHVSYKDLWNDVRYAQASSVERVPLGGYDYIVEDIPLMFTLS